MLPTAQTQSKIATKSDSNITVVATYKRTLVADTDVEIDIPAGVKLAFVFHALGTPVFAALDGAVTIPVAGAASQACWMFPPNIGVAYAMWDNPTTVATHHIHLRSASAGDVWLTLATE